VNDGVNYVYIPEFARYYFVDDAIKLNNNITEFRLSVDVLASMRSEILPKSAYVTRAYSQTDNTLTDTFYPSISGTKQIKNSVEFVPLQAPAYILSAMGIDPGAISATGGAVQYYIVTAEDVAEIVKFIFDETNYQDDISEGVVKTFFNPSQYLVSCLYCPFVNSFPSGNKEHLRFGWWETAETYTKINPSAPLVMDDITLNIPRPVSDANDYRNYAPYATYRLYLPFYGMFDLDSE